MLDENNKLGSFIRIARQDKDLSMSNLAKRCGVSVAFISYLESGKISTASNETLQSICKELGLDIDEILLLVDRVPEDIKDKLKTNPKLFCKKIRDL